MSPSSRPTFAPALARPTATLTATVDLPTPPLPAPIAIICLTFGSGLFAVAFCCGEACTCAVNSTVTEATPGTCLTAATTSACILSLSGQAGVVSSTPTLTVSPLISTFLIILRVTRSLCSSGSFTVLSWFMTASLVIAMVIS